MGAVLPDDVARVASLMEDQGFVLSVNGMVNAGLVEMASKEDLYLADELVEAHDSACLGDPIEPVLAAIEACENAREPMAGDGASKAKEADAHVTE